MTLTNQADNQYKNLVKKILDEGYSNEGTKIRAKYEDGTPAYAKNIFGLQIDFDNDKELPILTIKHVAWKSAIKEMLLFWANQTVEEKHFKEKKVSIWDEWFNKEGNLGRSYGYQMESHRNHEKRLVPIKQKLVEFELPNISEIDDDTRGVNNFTDEEFYFLHQTWLDMMELIFSKKNLKSDKPIGIDPKWLKLKNFMLDARYIPQWFLLKDNISSGGGLFKEYTDIILSRAYYKTNYFSKETCVWFNRNEHYMIDSSWYEEELNNKVVSEFNRPELSRNQVVELINGLKKDPTSRRHMTSFWNFADAPHKQLQECAWATNLNVQGDVLNFTLIQRSLDVGLGCPFNWLQYAILHRLIAHVCGYKVGKFKHQIGDAHIYLSHVEELEKMCQGESHQPPELKINENQTDFFNFTIDDFDLVCYNNNGKFNNLPVAI